MIKIKYEHIINNADLQLYFTTHILLSTVFKHTLKIIY